MTRFIIQSLILALVGFLVASFLPWYSLGPCFGLLAYGLNMRKAAFFKGFVSAGTLWLLWALVLDQSQPSTLPQRMSELLPLGGQVWLLYLLTALIGGLFGGFWTWAGAQLRRA